MTASSITRKQRYSRGWSAAHTPSAVGERLYEKLDTMAWVPTILWKLCNRIAAVGEAVLICAERIAPRLGVELVADVLEPMLDRGSRV
jgi:hypothetical protein